MLTAVLIFASTGVAKLISTWGSNETGHAIFGYRDPVFHVQFRVLFLFVGVAELGIAGYCLVARNPIRQLWVVGLFSITLAIYRLGVWYLGYHTPCTCLGTLTDSLHLNPRVADTVMKSLLGYLLASSFVLLACRRAFLIGRNASTTSAP